LTTSENEKLDRPGEHQTGLDHNQSDEIQPTTPVQMTADEARRLTNSIRLSATRMTDLLVKAYEQRAWAALHYISWEAYCHREFGNLKLRMPRDERAETVAELREAGMSIRAIAAGTGLDPKTVHKDLKKNQLWEIPTPETVVGTDGKKHPAKKKPARQSKREYIDAELKAMKAKAKPADESHDSALPDTPSANPVREVTAIVKGVITDLDTVAVEIDRFRNDSDWKINPGQRKDIADAINRCAEALDGRMVWKAEEPDGD
jgi:hypothetical protein